MNSHIDMAELDKLQSSDEGLLVQLTSSGVSEQHLNHETVEAINSNKPTNSVEVADFGLQ